MNAIAIFKDSPIIGYCAFHQCDVYHKTIVTVFLQGFVPNSTHAFHCHEFGDLSDGCNSLCSHFNPLNKKHGSASLHGLDRHIGDFYIENLIANKEGTVNIVFEDDLVDLIGIYSIIGRSVIIHANADDGGKYRDEDTDRGRESGKTGNAGNRIACAVIGVSKKNFHPIKLI
jgi:Cu-Zn family superoxide dismutase